MWSETINASREAVFFFFFVRNHGAKGRSRFTRELWVLLGVWGQSGTAMLRSEPLVSCRCRQIVHETIYQNGHYTAS